MTRPRVAIASCREREQWVVADDPVLADAFEDAGAEAMILDWDKPDADWASFDAVVIRSTWDYTRRLDEFTAWLAHVDGCTLLLNPADVVRSNLDKLYLGRLGELGVPIVPTRVIRAGEPFDLGEACAEWSCAQVAVKPALGAGAIGLLIAGADETERVSAHIAELLIRGPVIVQPFMPAVSSLGELSLVYLDGRYSHAVRKIPRAGENRVQVEYGGIYTVEEPSEPARFVADRAMRAWPEGLLYARVDLLETAPGEYRVIECELVEPELFFRMLPETADAFARLTLARVGSRSQATPAQRP